MRASGLRTADGLARIVILCLLQQGIWHLLVFVVVWHGGLLTQGDPLEQVAVRLSARNLAELNDRLDDLQQFLADADEADGKQMYVITVATAPSGR